MINKKFSIQLKIQEFTYISETPQTHTISFLQTICQIMQNIIIINKIFLKGKGLHISIFQKNSTFKLPQSILDKKLFNYPKNLCQTFKVLFAE